MYNYYLEAMYRNAGIEPGETWYDECTCVGPYISPITNPGCWFHGEELDHEEWVRYQGADWCAEYGFDPNTGLPTEDNNG